MREILFRGKHIHVHPKNEHLDGTWVYGYLCDENYINTVDEDEYGGKFTSEMLIDPETVCQYTGLSDKNGRKIFEGDIVKGVAYSTDFVGYIVWIDAIAGFGVRYFNKHREPTAWENSSILKAIQRWKQPNEFQAEIIGNIFDDPELLHEKEKVYGEIDT